MISCLVLIPEVWFSQFLDIINQHVMFYRTFTNKKNDSYISALSHAHQITKKRMDVFKPLCLG